jgi:hypothetical protein
LKPALLAGDAAPVMARRALAKLIDEERANASPVAESLHGNASAQENKSVFAK